MYGKAMHTNTLQGVCSYITACEVCVCVCVVVALSSWTAWQPCMQPGTARPILKLLKLRARTCTLLPTLAHYDKVSYRTVAINDILGY